MRCWHWAAIRGLSSVLKIATPIWGRWIGPVSIWTSSRSRNSSQSECDGRSSSRELSRAQSERHSNRELELRLHRSSRLPAYKECRILRTGFTCTVEMMDGRLVWTLAFWTIFGSKRTLPETIVCVRQDKSRPRWSASLLTGSACGLKVSTRFSVEIFLYFCFGQDRNSGTMGSEPAHPRSGSPHARHV